MRRLLSGRRSSCQPLHRGWRKSLIPRQTGPSQRKGRCEEPAGKRKERSIPVHIQQFGAERRGNLVAQSLAAAIEAATKGPTNWPGAKSIQISNVEGLM